VTTATYSSSRTAGHVVDRDFLFAVEAMLMGIIEKYQGRELDVRTELLHRNGPHGKLNTKGSSVAEALIDATGFADEFKISIFGTTPGRGRDANFMISMDVRPDSSDHIYADGPADLVHEAHESMRAAFEARETLFARRIEDENALAAARDPALWRRVSTNDRTLRHLEKMVPYGFFLAYCVLLYLMIVSPNRLLLPVGAALFAVIAVGIGSIGWIPANRKRREAKLEARASAAGMVFPGKQAKPIRLIDMRHGRPGDADRLAYDPAVPLVL